MALPSSLLLTWKTAAQNHNQYSMLTPEQTDMYLRTTTQLSATDDFLDEKAHHFIPSFNRVGFPVHSNVPKKPFKPYLDEFVDALQMQVIGMRLFEPQDAFVALRVDPMRDLMLVLHFKFTEPFAMVIPTATTTTGSFIRNKLPPSSGAYITNVMFESPVTLSGHKKILSLQEVEFAGYFYGTRERILFDQADAALPVFEPQQ